MKTSKQIVNKDFAGFLGDISNTVECCKLKSAAAKVGPDPSQSSGQEFSKYLSFLVCFSNSTKLQHSV